MLLQSGLAMYQVNRRAFLGPCFGEEQRAVGKIERGLSVFAGRSSPPSLPVKPPGDHQMNDEKEFVFQREDDALAEAAKRQNSLSFSGANRQIEGPKTNGLPDGSSELADSGLVRECLDVNNNVRKLRHVDLPNRMENLKIEIQNKRKELYPNWGSLKSETGCLELLAFCFGQLDYFRISAFEFRV